MSEQFVFDSRCELCKAPYGAVTCAAAVTYHLRPLATEGFSHCSIIFREEFSGKTTQTELFRDGADGERIRFTGTVPAPQQPELVWYHFRFWREDGSGCLLDRSGYHSEGSVQEWQLTVYDDSAETPAWFGEGVTYQIFPDRFCRLETPKCDSLIGNRAIHENWDETPEWRPDPDGEIRCRDFFGGSLAGICSRLDDLAALGVTTLYLNPIFYSASNHRYNTADYRRIDPMLGTEDDFRTLCAEAHRRGMRVILDGVFNHTGSDSIYFNADGHFPELGAAQSQDSRYAGWYHFSHWPDQYDAWWGIRTLPAVEESNPDYRAFIAGGEDSVVRHWLNAGADGWRLDVADELPDDFISDIRTAVTQTKPDGLLLGEVWEDGSNKIAYSQRRKYLLGSETHGLMNYPFRTAALAWLQGGSALDFCEAMETIREHYPRPAFYAAMNFLGTHDTPRILSLLGSAAVPSDRDGRAHFRLSAEEYARGQALLKLAAVLLFAFPGSPTIFYGDEAGVQGFEDPFNRGTYPWGHEDDALRSWYRLLGKLRHERVSLRRGELRWLCVQGRAMAFLREVDGEQTVAVLNAGDEPTTVEFQWDGGALRDALSGTELTPVDGKLIFALAPRSSMLFANQ
ncbi:MAG: glycoside hydrolase family 13 protein [Oscillibacter sp.]|jgi:4-alpha-glucanotransferase|nr:glycoside hydrolase family 13 protein [Oscillibacter sp.]